MKTVPLCVDLDGSLLRTDSLLESLFILLRRDLFAVLRLPLWVLSGRAHFKAQVAKRAAPEPETLPYHAEFLAWLRQQQAAGRPLVLATAANHRIADAVSAHLGIFERVIASDERANLKGRGKARALATAFGEKGFDYAGNDRHDLPVWAVARRAVLVGTPPHVDERVRAMTEVEARFERPRASLGIWLRALRLHQWLKNLLVFAPLLAAHAWNRPDAIAGALLAFLAFSFAASSAYLVNDLLDLAADRRHPRKRGRPFASGLIGLGEGIAGAVVLLAAAVVVALGVAPLFLPVLAGYYAATLLYSLEIKHLVVVDVLCLAALYTVRIIGGAAAIAVVPSFWLLAFSMFLFLSLAMVKRCAELRSVRDQGEQQAIGRGYRTTDIAVVEQLGGSAGYLSVLVLALYVNSPDSDVLYRRPEAMWLLCPLLLYWISRVWLKAHRGEMNDDPVVFAIRDRGSRWIGLLLVTIMLAAL